MIRTQDQLIAVISQTLKTDSTLEVESQRDGLIVTLLNGEEIFVTAIRLRNVDDGPKAGTNPEDPFVPDPPHYKRL